MNSTSPRVTRLSARLVTFCFESSRPTMRMMVLMWRASRAATTTASYLFLMMDVTFSTGTYDIDKRSSFTNLATLFPRRSVPRGACTLFCQGRRRTTEPETCLPSGRQRSRRLAQVLFRYLRTTGVVGETRRAKALRLHDGFQLPLRALDRVVDDDVVVALQATDLFRRPRQTL